MRTRITPNTGTFYAVFVFSFLHFKTQRLLAAFFLALEMLQFCVAIGKKSASVAGCFQKIYTVYNIKIVMVTLYVIKSNCFFVATKMCFNRVNYDSTWSSVSNKFLAAKQNMLKFQESLYLFEKQHRSVL